MKTIQVTGLDVEGLELYTKLNERQIKTFFEPDEGIFICESEKVIRRALDAGYEPVSVFCQEDRLAVIRNMVAQGMTVQRDIPVFVAPYEVMRSMTGYSLTGGILMAMRRKPLLSVEELLRTSRNVVVLDDVENPTNVGAIFRSAAALGADVVLLTEGCADPLYRRAARVSMGSVFQIEWTFADADMMDLLRENGFETYAFALTESAHALGRSEHSASRKAVILGNEEHGISKEILNRADHTVVIPMQRGVDSLNVAAASAVAFWEIFMIK